MAEGTATCFGIHDLALGQVVSAAALASGAYHAGLFDLPWTVSFVWVVASAARASGVAHASSDLTRTAPGLAEGEQSPHQSRSGDWSAGGLIAALPAMMLLSIWNLGTLSLQPTFPSSFEPRRAWPR